MNSAIRTALDRFDGKAVDPLKEVVEQARDHVPDLLRLVEEEAPSQQVGASWLLKQSADRGLPFTEEQVQRMVALLGQELHWEVILHLLQTLPAAPIPESVSEEAWDILLQRTRHRKPFIRAWSFHALHHLAEGHPAFRPEAREVLHDAMADEAASVKARIRNVLKASDWAGPSQKDG